MRDLGRLRATDLKFVKNRLDKAEHEAWGEVVQAADRFHQKQASRMERMRKAAADNGAAAADGAADDGAPPLKKAKRPPAPIPRTRLDRRPDESEEERQARVRTESGSRKQRDKAQRAFDQQKRRALQRTPTTIF